MTRRICAVLSAACIAVLASGTASWAGEKPAVCHPTGKGYVLINPAQASSHIDEQSGAPKHEHDGRVDVYAVNGACPAIPTTTPTGGTPSSTTTSNVPSTTTSASPSITTSVSSPSTTSSTPTTKVRPGASTGSSTAPSAAKSERPSSASRTYSPTTATTSHLSSAPSSTAELAATGSSLDAAVVAAFLLTVGGLLKLASRRKGAHR